MPQRSQSREILFTISDVGRMLRTYADQKARRFGMTRAQWAVLMRLERREGLKQSELAEMLDLQPITLTRLVDRLCDNGADRAPRRPKRSPRQAAFPDTGSAAADGPARCARPGRWNPFSNRLAPESSRAALDLCSEARRQSARHLLAERTEQNSAADAEKHYG